MTEVTEMITLFAPISKIDEEKRMVYGYATTPSKDSQDERVDLQASFDAVDEWAKWANIKEMHRPETAAGVAPVIEKHVGVGVYIGAKVVDDQAWRKCKEGVYKGFSIGGKVLERAANDCKLITKYRLNEISLVDRPANPDSLFMVAKRDDSVDKIDAHVSKEAGGVSVEDITKKEEASNTVAPVPEVLKAEAVAVATPEMMQVSKADFDKMTADLAKMKELETKSQELEKRNDELSKSETVKDILLKAIEKLQPEIKKAHEEMVTLSEADKEAEMKKQINNISHGELTSQMLKSAEKK
jgi:phage head maturation protease